MFPGPRVKRVSSPARAGRETRFQDSHFEVSFSILILFDISPDPSKGLFSSFNFSGSVRDVSETPENEAACPGRVRDGLEGFPGRGIDSQEEGFPSSSSIIVN